MRTIAYPLLYERVLPPHSPAQLGVSPSQPRRPGCTPCAASGHPCGVTRSRPKVENGEHARKRSVNLEDEFEFDRHVQGQLGRAEGQAGMASGLSENLNEQIRRTIDDGRLLCEAFRRGHVAGQSYDAGHAV